MNTNTISIQNIETLIYHMKTMEFSVEWRVTSDIGPDWIGSSRTVAFYLEDKQLSETEFRQQLENKLVELIPIPSESKDHVITGDGIISLKGNQLEIYYSWEAAIPYQDPELSKEGKLLFYP